MTEHPDPAVRAAHVRLLWAVPCDATFSRLMALLRNETHPGVLAATAHALGRYIWSGMQIDPFLDEEFGFAENVTIEQVEEARRCLHVLCDAEQLPSRTRFEALRALAHDPDDRTVARIDELARTGRLEDLLEAVACMGRSGLPRWHQVIMALLEETGEADVLRAALDAAGEACIEAAEPRIVQLTRHPDREVVLAAVWALRNVVVTEAGRQRLLELLDAPDLEVAERARAALVELDALDDEDMAGP